MPYTGLYCTCVGVSTMRKAKAVGNLVRNLHLTPAVYFRLTMFSIISTYLQVTIHRGTLQWNAVDAKQRAVSPSSRLARKPRHTSEHVDTSSH